MFRRCDGGWFCRSSPPLLRPTTTRQVETSVHQRIYLNCIEVDHVSVKPKLRGYFGSQRLGSKAVLFSISLSNYEYTMGRFKSIRQTTTFALGSLYIFPFPGGESSASPTMENSTKPQILVILWDTSVYGRLSHII